MTRAALRPESINPHIPGVDLMAAFKPTLHKKFWNGIYSSKLTTQYPCGDPNRKHSFLQVSWEERGFTDIWVIQKLFSAHFLFGHRAVVDAKKPNVFEVGFSLYFCRLLGGQITYLTKIQVTYLTEMPLQLLTLKQTQCPSFSGVFLQIYSVLWTGWEIPFGFLQAQRKAGLR